MYSFSQLMIHIFYFDKNLKYYLLRIQRMPHNIRPILLFLPPPHRPYSVSFRKLQKYSISFHALGLHELTKLYYYFKTRFQALNCCKTNLKITCLLNVNVILTLIPKLKVLGLGFF